MYIWDKYVQSIGFKFGLFAFLKKSLTYSDLDHIKMGQNWLFYIGYQNYDSNPIFMMSGHDMACIIFTQEKNMRERS